MKPGIKAAVGWNLAELFEIDIFKRLSWNFVHTFSLDELSSKLSTTCMHTCLSSPDDLRMIFLSHKILQITTIITVESKCKTNVF